MVAIAVFKLFKGALLLLVGFGLLELMHADIATVFSRLLEFLHINADTRLVHALVLKVDALQPHSVLMAGLVSLGYAALLLAEGIGLWLEVSWAAYLTVVSTSALVPVEVYELIERVTLPRIILLVSSIWSSSYTWSSNTPFCDCFPGPAFLKGKKIFLIATATTISLLLDGKEEQGTLWA
jgi:uncharacterized membrane protein (DUF2068 family)